MAIIKAPLKQAKSVTVQARVEESVKARLDQYAQFIDSTPSYVITEALKVLFKRDDEFKAWLSRQSDQESKSERPSSKHEVPSSPRRNEREHAVCNTPQCTLYRR